MIGISLLLTGCQFSFGETGKVVTISGYVTFDDTPLAGVNIQSDFKVFTTTNELGFYTFDTRTINLKFYSKKAGYSFLPKTVTLDDNTTQYNFIAIKAEPLSGKLMLKSILISPTSITSLVDNNYTYIKNSTSYLKISEFVLQFNSEETARVITPLYAAKNTYTDILSNYNQNFSVDIENGKTGFEFKFQLKTYFTYNFGQNESVSIEPFKYLKESALLDDGNLNENGEIKFSASGINSVHNGFTYDIQFVFNYVK